MADHVAVRSTYLEISRFVREDGQQVERRSAKQVARGLRDRPGADKVGHASVPEDVRLQLLSRSSGSSGHRCWRAERCARLSKHEVVLLPPLLRLAERWSRSTTVAHDREPRVAMTAAVRRSAFRRVVAPKAPKRGGDLNAPKAPARGPRSR
jgi:hypothetical protein